MFNGKVGTDVLTDEEVEPEERQNTYTNSERENMCE